MSRFIGSIVFSGTVYLSLVGVAAASEQETAARPLPTPGQATIVAALDQPAELDFRDQPLTDVIEFLRQKHQIEIQLDTKALSDAGVGSDTPITRRLQGITLRSALRLLLSELDLTYIVGHGYLMITSKTEAENRLIFKVYPVKDLVTFDSEFRPKFATGADDGDYAGLIDMIACTVAPTTWDEGTGPPRIHAYRKTWCLAFSQTQEVHDEVAELLTALRSVRDQQLAAARKLQPQVQEQAPAKKSALQVKVYHLTRIPPCGGFSPAGAVAATSQGDEKPMQVEAAAAVTTDDKCEIRLDGWANAIAEMVPGMIEPQSWQPSGEGQIRAVGSTVVVQQSAEVQYQVAKLLNQLLPGSVPLVPSFYPAVRLQLPAIKADWPHDSEPKPRDVEAQISTALDWPCELDFRDQPLTDVIEFLRQKHQIEILLDTKPLSDAGVGSDTPVTRSLKGVSLRTALKLLLDELDLTYLIRDEVLIITSKTEAENTLSIKVYPVFDLIVRPADAPTDRPALDFQSLIENVRNNIAPKTWDEVGGPGAIQPFTNSGALVIFQTTEAHEEIAEFLKALREVGQEQKSK
jgi:hypothetical protein